VLQGLSLTLRAGELVCLLGANGAGKSTLLRTLSRVQPPLGGSVVLAGRDLRTFDQAELARTLSVVLTDRVNVGMLQVADLVALGRYPHTGWSGRLSPRDIQVVEWALRMTGSDELATRDCGELSDGERQRVMIARALAQEPTIMLLDEPTAFLDLPRRLEIIGMLRRLAYETGLAVLLSTHDLELALRTADRMWVTTRDGGMEVGAPEDIALGGALDRAYGTRELRFDHDQAGFRLHHAAVGHARVRADGVHALWAARMLERLGYNIASTLADLERVPDLEVEAVNGAVWRASRPDNGTAREFTSLGELADFARRVTRVSDANRRAQAGTEIEPSIKYTSLG
jgi:iron complex transport system ATP-binding protein